MPSGTPGRVQPVNPSRRWLITDNTIPADFETSTWKDKFLDQVAYATWQKEQAASGKVHIQAFVKLKKPIRLLALKTLLGNIHAEVSRGTDEQCIAYCNKQDTRLDGPFTFGELTKQGTRRDLDEVGAKLLKGVHPEDIAIEDTGVYIRYHRGIHAAATAIQAKKTKTWRDVDVKVFWGKAGTGKTRRCYTLHPDVYRVHTSGNVWFDGYSGQEAILFDDFYGQVSFAYMLQLLDGYPLRVPIKGGFAAAGWTTVYITSNTQPSDWWAKSGIPEASRDAFRRRIKSVEEFSDDTLGSQLPGELVPPAPKFIAPRFPRDIIPVPDLDDSQESNEDTAVDEIDE